MEQEEKVLLRVKTLSDQIVTTQISLKDTVLNLKRQVASEVQIPEQHQRLIYQGRHLQNEDTLESCGVVAEATLHVIGQAPQPQPVQQSQPQPARASHPPLQLPPQLAQLSGTADIPRQRRNLVSQIRRNRFPRRRDFANAERFETIRQNLQTLRGFSIGSQMAVLDRFRNNLEVRQWVDVIDTVDQWLEAQIIDKRNTEAGEEVFVHYNGWPDHWDEWIPVSSNRIQPLHTHTVQSIRSAMSSPNPQVRPDAAQLESRTPNHSLDEYIDQSIDMLDKMKAMLDHYNDLRRQGEEPSVTDQFKEASRDLIPVLDRTGRLMTDLSECIYSVSQLEQCFPPMHNARDVYTQNRRQASIEIHIYNNYDPQHPPPHRHARPPPAPQATTQEPLATVPEDPQEDQSDGQADPTSPSPEAD